MCPNYAYAQQQNCGSLITTIVDNNFGICYFDCACLRKFETTLGPLLIFTIWNSVFVIKLKKFEKGSGMYDVKSGFLLALAKKQ